MTTSKGSVLVTHERVTDREAERLKAVGAARSAVGRKRKGLNTYEERKIIEMLRTPGTTWLEVERKFGSEIEAEVLAAWRKPLEERAAAADRPRLASDDQPKE
jgi:hypothetical protein